MRKMIALFLILSLLLCGCGGTQPASSAETASQAPESVPAAEEASVADESLQEASTPEIPTDPVELGKWVYHLADAADETITAYDVDVTATSSITMGETPVDTRTTYRIKELIAEDESVTYYSSSLTDGLTSEIWYADGTVYSSDIYGSYKAPMDQDAFLEEYSLLSEVEGIDETSFGTLTAEATDSGYIMTYGNLTPDGALAFMDFYSTSLNDELSGSGLAIEITDLTMDGVSEMDKEGYPIRDEKTVVMTYTLAGESCSLESTTIIDYNKAGSDLTINVPAQDDTFKDTTDVKVAEYFINGYTLATSALALSYESAVILAIGDETQQDTYLITDAISYTMASGSLSALWETIHMANNQVTYYSTDEYAGGQGTFTTAEGTEAYTYDDISMFTDVASFIAYNSDSFDYGFNYTLVSEGDETALSFELDPEYVEIAIDAYLSMYAPDYSLYEADSLDCSGTMVVGFDASGMMTVQTLNCLCVADFGGIPLTFSLSDSGVVTATGADVTLGSAFN